MLRLEAYRVKIRSEFCKSYKLVVLELEVS